MENGEILSQFLSKFNSGHAFDTVLMWGLIGAFFVSMAIIIERVYMVLFVYTINAGAFMQKIQRLVLDNNIDEAIKLCDTHQKAVIPRLFKAALMNAHRPFEEVQDHMEVAKLGVIPELQKRMSYLFTIGNVATLLGLLGTVFGLVVSFSGAKHVEASQKQLMLTAGISSALTATFYGLCVAIPCMLFYGFLFNRVNGLMDEIEHYSGRLLMLLKTGSEYFDRFSADKDITTEQQPKKAPSTEQEITRKDNAA